MKTLERTLILIFLFAVALAPISCSREKEQNKGMANLSPEQSKALEAYKKSLEESKNTVVAKVDGVDISMHDLIKEMNEIAPQHIKPGQEKDPKVDEKVRNEALDRLLYRELAVQAAVRQGMKVAPEKIGDELTKMKANLKSEDVYKGKLQQSGLTEEELKKQIERNLLVDMITEKEIFGKVTVAPADVEKEYAKKKASYRDASGKPMSFENARPLIQEALMKVAVAKREDEWTGGLKKAAKIEITLDQSARAIHPVR